MAKITKKGYYFSIDALIGMTIMILAIILIPLLYIEKPETLHLNYFSEDLSELLSNIKVNEIEDDYAKQLINNSMLSNPNSTVMEAIGELWILGKKSEATQLAKSITDGLIPETYNLGIWVEGGNVSSSEATAVNMVTAKRMLSGLENGSVRYGQTARVFLKNINKKSTSSYAFFDGYVGDGTITKYFFLPKIGDLTSAYLEMDSGNDFDFYFNDALYGRLSRNLSGGMRADRWGLNISKIIVGEGLNTIKIRFATNNSNYIGGGYLRVSYDTPQPQFSFPANETTETYYFPGIEGVVNLYSSFYSPGELQSMDVYLHYNSDFALFLNIGNVTFSFLEGAHEAILSDAAIKSKLGDYSAYSGKTIPLRLGSRNISYTVIGFGGTADSVLITDTSGSMEDNDACTSLPTGCKYDCCREGYCPAERALVCNYTASCIDEECGSCGSIENMCSYDCCFDFWGERCPSTKSCESATCADEECGDCGTYRFWFRTFDLEARHHNSVSGGPLTADNHFVTLNTTCRTRLEVAKEADKEFVDVVLSVPGNRVGLVSYSSTVKSTHNLSNNTASLYSSINSYTADGTTCICCGILKATSIINTQSNASRAKSMLVMTDGEANQYCSGMDPAPNHDGDWDTTNDPQDHAIEAACRAYNNYNITVYAVGFGDLSSQGRSVLTKIAQCGHGTYYYTNVSELTEIYKIIAENITNMSYTTQTVQIYKELESPNILYPNSYINFTYVSPQHLVYGSLPITIESPRFGNNITEGSILFPAGISISDIKVTSYSADKWTHLLQFKNDSNWTTVYRLADYGGDYYSLGDPYIVQLPVAYASPGKNNTIRVITGLKPENSTGGSVDNRAIYTINLKLFVNYSGVSPKAEGCNWIVGFDDGTNTTIKVPANYSGSDHCYYSCPFTEYKPGSAEDDAINKVVNSLFRQLDFDCDGRLYVNFDTADLNLDVTAIPGIPFVWGPAVVEVRAWQ